jgi:tight adherence protein C
MSFLFGLIAASAVCAAGYAAQPARTRPQVVEPPHVRTSARAARAAIERDYPAAIDLIVLAVRAGHLPLAAITGAIPHFPVSVRPAFAHVVQQCATGQRFADALTSLPTMLGPMAAPLADGLAAADRYGLPLAPVLERLAGEAHQRRRRRADVLARQLPVRLAVPLVLCTLPSFVLLAVVPLLLAAMSSLRQ